MFLLVRWTSELHQHQPIWHLQELRRRRDFSRDSLQHSAQELCRITAADARNAFSTLRAPDFQGLSSSTKCPVWPLKPKTLHTSAGIQELPTKDVEKLLAPSLQLTPRDRRPRPCRIGGWPGRPYSGAPPPAPAILNIVDRLDIL